MITARVDFDMRFISHFDIKNLKNIQKMLNLHLFRV